MNEINFGTDGWRAVIGEGFTFENVRRLSHALAQTFQNSKKEKKVFVGYDHRFMAERFAEESAKIVSLYGYQVDLLNVPVTSPVLSFLTWKKKALFGVMITASHNPPHYLGLKVKDSFGGSIAEETAQEIQSNLEKHSPTFSSLRPSGNRRNWKGTQVRELFSSYNHYLRAHLNLEIFKKNKSTLIFDSLYGPGAKFVKSFFESVLTKTHLEFIHQHRDPLFGGIQPEPILENLSDLRRSVREKKAVVGFALDGDGDRLGVVDELGNYLTPQQVFALLLYDLAAKRKLRGKVVQTVSLGYLSERIAQDFGLPWEEVPVGFKYVAQKMLSEEVLLGGEESGGYAFGKVRGEESDSTLLPERDGIFSALLFLEMILVSAQSASQKLKSLGKKYGKSFYLRRDLKLLRPIEERDSFFKKIQNLFPSRWLGLKIKEIRTQDGLKIIFGDDSWILMRPSGTEPLLRTYAEFPQENLTKKSLAKLSKLLYNVLNANQKANVKANRSK